MEVVVGKYAGFCGGVKLAVQKAEEAVNENKGIFCLGEVVHNKQVIENLESKGLKIVNDISEVPDEAKMIIRAHGESEKIYNIADARNIEVIDTTCGNVKLIHNKEKKTVLYL
jgi:4-hydroxy-3-methylbut-2-enyl diphosphate reductase